MPPNGFPGLTRKRPHSAAFLQDRYSSSPTPPTIPKNVHVKNKTQKKKAKQIPVPESRSTSPDPSELGEDLPPHDPHIVRAYLALDHHALLTTRLAGGYEHMYQAARLLPRLVGAYVDYDIVLSKGLARYKTYQDDDPDYVKRVFNEYWEVRYYFRKINANFPGLSDHHQILCVDTDLIAKMAAFITSVARKARSDDAGRIRKYIYEIAGWKDELLKSKAERGFNNVVTGRLLCPITKLDKFDTNPQQFCRYVRDRVDSPDRVWITADDWPMFLYDMDQYTGNDIKSGLLRSKLLLKCYKLVFTGPESAVPSLASGGHRRPKGKPPILKRFPDPAKTFTAFSIIYVACLTRHALNTESDWTNDDGDFIGREFVRTLLTLAIRNVDWQRDLVDWYKRHILDSPNSQRPPANRRTAYSMMMEENNPSEIIEHGHEEEEEEYAEHEEEEDELESA